MICRSYPIWLPVQHQYLGSPRTIRFSFLLISSLPLGDVWILEWQSSTICNTSQSSGKWLIFRSYLVNPAKKKKITDKNWGYPHSPEVISQLEMVSENTQKEGKWGQNCLKHCEDGRTLQTCFFTQSFLDILPHQ